MEYDLFDQLSACLNNHFDKLSVCLKNGIKYKNSDSMLCHLLKQKHCNQDWLNLLFEICDKCKFNFSNEDVTKAIDYINNNSNESRFKNGQIKSIIENVNIGKQQQNKEIQN